MTAMIGNFVPADLHIFDLGLGQAMAELVRQRYPRDTAKHLARAWNIDASTAANVVRGHCSERTLTKAFKAEGWALIAAMGAVITGESYAQYEERKLQSIIEEGARARENLVQLRARREALEASAGRALHALDRAPVDGDRDHDRRGRREADEQGHRPARQTTGRKG